ncbi:MAG: hypothetical protein ACOCWU_06635 [Spirochaetota bacterium]
MAVRDNQAIQSALLSKGFRAQIKAKKTDHHYFVFFLNGEKTSVWTKISRGKRRDVSGGLFSAMARQCKLRTSQFCDLVDCPLDEQTYLALLREQGDVSP